MLYNSPRIPGVIFFFFPEIGLTLLTSPFSDSPPHHKVVTKNLCVVRSNTIYIFLYIPLKTVLKRKVCGFCLIELLWQLSNKCQQLMFT